MLAGTLAAPAAIRRGGHIRAFAAFVALAVVSVVLMPVFVSPWAGLPSARSSASFSPASMRSSKPGSTQRRPTPTAARSTLLYQIANFSASAGRPDAAAPLGPAGFSAVCGRRRPAGAGDRSDGDDERRSAGPAPQRPAAPPLAHPRWRRSPAWRFSRRGRPTAHPSRSDPSSPSVSACRPTTRRCSPSAHRDRFGARRLSARTRSPIASTAGWSWQSPWRLARPAKSR